MRTVLKITGPDRLKFLHGLITRDVPETGLGYGALLSPQGKYLADFFLWQEAEAVFLDVADFQAADLARRLGMYRLRSAVEIADSGLRASRGVGAMPMGAWPDPRGAALGWRAYGAEAGEDGTDWNALRVVNGVPEAGHELIVGESYILEMGFERLNGVDFRKGCFVGQEIVARMKHKTELRKGLATLRLPGALEGTPLETEGKEAGRVHTVAGDLALAYLRFDRAGDFDVLNRWI